MSDSKSSGNLSIGDVISFVALLLMGVLVFFGMNFMTLGDRIPSIIVAALIVVLMTVFVMLAAFAKRQDRDQSTWKKVKYAMVALYILGLIPCYIFVSQFFDVQFQKDYIMEQVQDDSEDLDDMFASYERICGQRVNAYEIDLSALLSSPEGRREIAQMLDIKDPTSVTRESIRQAVESFSKGLTGGEFKTLKREKASLIDKCKSNFNNWNIMLLPQYANELGNAKAKYAEDLNDLYNKKQNKYEKNVPDFDAERYVNDSHVIETFTSTDGFSIVGFLVVLFLGLLGLVKFMLGEKTKVVPFEMGDSSSIEDDGGIVC